MFICKKCHKVDVPRRGNRRKCLECDSQETKAWKASNPEKQRQYNRRSLEHRHLVKQICIGYLGGKCQNTPKCFYPFCEAEDDCTMMLHFHHRDPDVKDFEISRRLRVRGINQVKSTEDLKKYAPELAAELDKCILLCSNCHARLEYCSNCQRS